MTKKIKQFVSHAKLVVPLALCFIASLILNLAYQAEGDNNRDVILRQKQYMVDMIAVESKLTSVNSIDKANCTDLVSSLVVNGVEHLDTQPHTLGVLYDENLHLISERKLERGVSSDKQIFLNPMKDASFAEIVKKEEQGVYRYTYDHNKVMKVYYKWASSDCSPRVLLVTGITDDLVQTHAGTMAIVNTIIILTAMSGYVVIILWGPKLWSS